MQKHLLFFCPPRSFMILVILPVYPSGEGTNLKLYFFFCCLIYRAIANCVNIPCHFEQREVTGEASKMQLQVKKTRDGSFMPIHSTNRLAIGNRILFSK